MGFWDVSNPAKPIGIKDPDATLDFPISFEAWLLDISDVYASHSVVTTGGLVLVSDFHAAGVITLFLAAGVVGETASFTVKITTAGGRKDDRTFYLSIKER